MHRKSNSCFCAAFPLAVVACVSLAIVAGVVIWMAAQEGTGPGELLANMLQRQRPARPVLPQNTPLPTVTFHPSPTPALVGVVTPQGPAAEAIPPTQPVQALVTEVPPTSSAVGNPAPASTPLGSSPQAAPVPQLETVIESPIRPSSPLPQRPATRVVIPTMDLDVPVTLSPIVNQTWKVDHLGTDLVGHLEGTASPGDLSNVVLAGHVTVAHNVYGPFAGLGQLKQGDSIILYAGNQAYTYVVDYRQLVDRTDIQIAYPTDTARVTLITCSNWSDELGAYQQRLIVVGHLAGEGS